MTEDIAIITSYYNPLHYQNRLHNYHRFRSDIESKGLKVWTMEVSSDGLFEIPKDETTFHARSESILWHKEQALNRLVELLPEEYSKVCWVDCDVLFPHDNVFKVAAELLEEFRVVQPFRRLVFLDPSGGYLGYKLGCAYSHSIGLNTGFVSPGIAWAAGRELFSNFGLFPLSVCGGGDSLAAAAFTGIENQEVLEGYNNSLLRKWRKWAEGVGDYVCGSMGYVDVDVWHLWHGNRGNRQYKSRLQLIQDVNFDKDIKLNKDRMLEWKWRRSEMNRRIEGYLSGRLEDGGRQLRS